MRKTKRSQLISDYLEKIGAKDPSNDFLMEEFDFNEKLGACIKKEINELIEKKGMFNTKGKLTQAYEAYRKYVRTKIDLAAKLVMTPLDRSKMKALSTVDAEQLEFDEFMDSIETIEKKELPEKC
jgi:hypothetical protein